MDELPFNPGKFRSCIPWAVEVKISASWLRSSSIEILSQVATILNQSEMSNNIEWVKYIRTKKDSFKEGDSSE